MVELIRGKKTGLRDTRTSFRVISTMQALMLTVLKTAYLQGEEIGGSSKEKQKQTLCIELTAHKQASSLESTSDSNH